MFYKLNNDISLKGWIDSPYSFYKKNDIKVKGLKKEEFELLCKCNGENDISNIDLLKPFIKDKIIVKCELGDSIEDWQKPHFYANNYFSFVHLEITGKCNYKCKHCFIGKKNKKNELSLDECKKIINECEKSGVLGIAISGGEPLLHPNFMEIINECVKKGIKVSNINTNASLITEKILDDLKNMNILPEFQISFDGIGYHDWMRGIKGIERKTIDIIRLIKLKGFPIRICMNVNKKNIKSLYETVNLFDKIGIEEFNIMRTCESDSWKSYEKNLTLNFKEYYDIGLDFIQEYIKEKHSMKIDFWHLFKFNPNNNEYSFFGVFNNEDYEENIPICFNKHLCINYDGSIIFCRPLNFFCSSEYFNFENVKTKSLQQILLDSEFLDYSKCTVGERLKKNEKCRNCKFKKQCLGGCCAIAFLLSNDIMGMDISRCIFFEGKYIEKFENIFNSVNKTQLF